MKSRGLLVAGMVLAVVSAVVVSEAALQAPESTPLTQEEQIKLLEMQKKFAVVLRALSAQWEAWPLIPGAPSQMMGAGPDGMSAVLGSAVARHNDTEYGHADVVMVYSFGAKQYCFAQVTVDDATGYIIRGEDGALFIPTTFRLELKADAAGELESYTFAYELADGTKGRRTFTRLTKA